MSTSTSVDPEVLITVDNSGQTVPTILVDEETNNITLNVESDTQTVTIEVDPGVTGNVLSSVQW